MKKRLTSFLLVLTMVVSMINFGTLFVAPVKAAGGGITLIATQDTYVQGSSQASVAKGKEDPNNLNARDWSDKPGAPSAMHFRIYSLNSRAQMSLAVLMTLKVLNSKCSA